jgi:hypothetical protein
MLIQYLYRDEPNIARFQSGLVKLNGARKPSFAAFELPLAEISRTGSTVALWGQLRSPQTTSTASLQAKRGAAWRTLATLRAGSGGYVTWRGVLAPATQVRLVSGSVAGAPIAIR